MKSRNPELDAYYSGIRDAIHSCGAFGRAKIRIHRRLESHRDGAHFPLTVELGAGGMQHIRHVRHTATRYIALDIRDFSDDAQRSVAERPASIASVELMVGDATSLPFDSDSVDRVVASCLIMHLEDPYLAVREWLRVCKPTGVVDFLVPCDPGVVLRLFRWLINERVARRHGVTRHQYRLLNALDHISSFERIGRLVREAVPDDRTLTVRYRPFALPSWNLNGFAIFSVAAADGA